MSLPAYGMSTADLAAACRAWHLRTPNPLFIDPFAERLCGPVLGFALRVRPIERFLAQFVSDAVLPVAASIAARARFGEAAIEQAIGEGAKQYVILGAGMDSFAYRRPDLMQRASVFEVDHPVTQRRKLRRLRRAGLPIATNHHFIAADLASVSPIEALQDSPFDNSLFTCISLLGVAYYISVDTLRRTLQSISADLPGGTRLALDWLLDRDSSDQRYARMRRDVVKFVAQRGEPMRARYSVEDMRRVAATCGFKTIKALPVSTLGQEYGGNKGGPLPAVSGIFGVAVLEAV